MMQIKEAEFLQICFFTKYKSVSGDFLLRLSEDFTSFSPKDSTLPGYSIAGHAIIS